MAYEPQYGKDSSAQKTLSLGFPSVAFYEKGIGFEHYLNTRLSDSFSVRTIATNTLDSFTAKIMRREYAIALVNGEHALAVSRNGYHIVAKFSNDQEYRGVIIVRKNAHIKNITELKGKTIVCPGLQALAGTKMPLYHLATHGLNLTEDLRITQVASFESVYMNVYLGKSDAGTTWISSWEAFTRARPEIANDLMAIWPSDPLPNIALVIRNDVSGRVEEQLVNSFLSMHNDAAGKQILVNLGIVSFEKANVDTYRVMQKFIDQYQKLAGSLKL